MFNFINKKLKNNKEQKQHEDKEFIDNVSSRLNQLVLELSSMKNANEKVITELTLDVERFFKMLVLKKFNRTSFSLEFEYYLKRLRSYRYDGILNCSETCSRLIDELTSINHAASNGIPGGLTRF